VSALAEEIKSALREVLREELAGVLARVPSTAPQSLPRGRLSVPEAAELARRHPDTVRRAIKAGELHATKPVGAREWILDRAEVERWIRGSHSPDPTSMQADVERAVARAIDG